MHWEEVPSTWCCVSHILMHWGDDPSTLDCITVHYTVLQAEEPAALVKIPTMAHSCIQNRVTHECRSPFARFPTLQHHRMFQHSWHTCPMQVPCSEFCTAMILHVHQIHIMRSCTHWGFPCMISSLPPVFSTANPLTSAFAAPLQRCSP